MAEDNWSKGAAYVDGRYVPIAEAAIPITDWGYRRSDVTYDVVSVWGGGFFRRLEHGSFRIGSENRLKCFDDLALGGVCAGRVEQRVHEVLVP